ncbi:MAG: hypothetical protein JNM93_05365, partial [Bacteriovoracaceae bacterium]|nr:hypothetical protein [Bacteriovoracaceae bacterium]
GTQEGRQQQIQELEQLVSPLKLATAHREWIDERMYPSLFVDMARHQILDSGDFWLSETPKVAGSCSFNSKYPRVTTWVETKNFIIFNVHLDHVSESTRVSQTRVLCQEIKKINTKNRPMIIMGDFNSSPSGSERKALSENFPQLYDPWQKLKMPEESSHHPFDGIGKGGSRIDWILATIDFKIQKLILDKSHQDSLYPSDHFPVYAEFMI